MLKLVLLCALLAVMMTRSGVGAPTLRILKPEHAGRARGPDVEIAWHVEPDGGVSGQSVSIDGGKPKDLPADAQVFSASGLSQGVHTATVRATAGGSSAACTSTFYVYVPKRMPAAKLYTLDLTSLMKVNVEDSAQAANAFDTLHVAGVLQGLVNRENPRLYLFYTNVDRFWFERITGKGAYLEKARIVPLGGMEEAIAVFRDRVKGVVVWDPGVAATSNVASTICGVENLIPARFDETPGSMYDRLISNGPKLAVVHNLVGKFTGTGKIPDSDRDSTGSAKCDAYIWAKMRYLDTAKCNPREIGYWCDAFWLRHPTDMSLDNVGLTDHDFVVARKGSICDLNVWPDEAPRDDPDQRNGVDRETLQEILLSCYKAGKGKMIHVSGFTPWAIKYTSFGSAGGKHEPVPTEWETARLISAYNAFLDADAIGYVGMANASVFQHCPLPDRLVQNRPPTRKELEEKGYINAQGNVAKLNFVYHYLGDYDSAAWMYHRLPEIWNNPVRGQVPSGWAFNPNLIERLPVAFDWVYETKSPADYFIAGDNGAGYLNPRQLLPPRNPSGLPTGAEAWIEHSVPYFRKLDYSITGFVINGFAGDLNDECNRMYLRFSGDGIMTQPLWMPGGKKQNHLLDGMVVAEMKQDITAPVDTVVEWITRHGRPNETAFLSFRSILVGPDWIRTVNGKIRERKPECRFEPVDPYMYFYLLRHLLGGRNEKRATYTFDTLPDEVTANRKLRVEAGLRNDGWDTWKRSGTDAVRLHAGFGGRTGGVYVPLPKDVEPGEGVVLSFEIAAPKKTGKQAFHLELVRGSDGWFGDAGDMAWEKEVVVRRPSTNTGFSARP